MGYEQEIITVRFDKQMLTEYSGYDVDNPDEYFRAHPRAKKAPFEGLWGKRRVGLLPSTNKFIDCNDRVIQNQMKQEIGNYTTYCLKAQKVPAAYLKEFIVVAINYKPDKSKSDNDNIFVKASLDAMTKYEMWSDDNWTQLKLYQAFSVYCKSDPRTEIVIFPIYRGEYEFDFVSRYVTEYICRIEKQFEIIE